MKTIDDFNFSGKKALIRVDYNVPLDETLNVTDDTRIRASLPTLGKILDEGGAVILMAHLGRPKGEPEKKFSLENIIPTLEKLTGKQVKFSKDCIGEEALRSSQELKPGEILLLENLRFHNEEKEGNEEFAQKLAAMGDIYVNDAFGAAHRAHASTAIVANYFEGKKCFGYLMKKEIENLEKVLKENSRPFTAILGGAKVSDKVGVIENLLPRVQNLIIGGAMAYTFWKARGGNTGDSLVEEDKLDLCLDLIKKAEKKNVKLLIPVDSISANNFSNDAETRITLSENISSGWMGLDIGPEAIKEYSKVIEESKTILWNGPMGVFEMEKFQNGTKAIAEAVATATTNGSYSMVGGGDSVAAINKFNLDNKITFISTGGGAMLEYLEGKELPGVKAIKEG